MRRFLYYIKCVGASDELLSVKIEDNFEKSIVESDKGNVFEQS